jgi:hypothetical protein
MGSETNQQDAAPSHFNLKPSLTFAFDGNNLETVTAKRPFSLDQRISVAAVRKNLLFVHVSPPGHGRTREPVTAGQLANGGRKRALPRVTVPAAERLAGLPHSSAFQNRSDKPHCQHHQSGKVFVRFWADIALRGERVHPIASASPDWSWYSSLTCPRGRAYHTAIG